jgi:hypothetical protein
VLMVFIYTRPLNSSWHPFIAGDGLGYYSYLPAKYIYNDKAYTFKWFNAVHDSNYVYSTFPNPEDNLLVKYGNKRINKYYQGLSYIWLPFFAAAHVCAKLFHWPADGYSLPYQLAIGFASLFYLILGLIFLRKLLLKIFNDQLASVLIPFCIFYGTYLFPYAISANSLSHAYSFTFITLFLYFMVSFFKDDENKRLRNFLLCFLCLSVAVCIRPLTGLIIFVTPAFIPLGFFKRGSVFGKFKWPDALVILLAIGVLYHSASITRIQTGSFFAYTYTNEKFNFSNAKFFDALFSYHIGLFVYVPLVFLSLSGIPFLPLRKRIMLPLFFFFIVFLYSAWWYWPIVKRAVIDFYPLPAIMLGALITRYSSSVKGRAIFVSLALLCIGYFQLKNMQTRKGILDENATYGEVFWRNFFRTEKVNIYLVPPATIIKQTDFLHDYENETNANKSDRKAYSGKYSLLLDSVNYMAKLAEHPFPDIFNEPGFKKIRLSFQSYFTAGIKTVHVFIKFFDKENKEKKEVVMYLSEDDIPKGKWDYKEFGYELVDKDSLNPNTVNKISFLVWNVEAKKNMYIDDVKIEFMLTDRSFETIK